MKKLYMEGLNSFFFLEKGRFQTDSIPSALNDISKEVLETSIPRIIATEFILKAPFSKRREPPRASEPFPCGSSAVTPRVRRPRDSPSTVGRLRSTLSKAVLSSSGHEAFGGSLR